MGLADRVMLLSPVGVVIAAIAGFVPFLLVMFYKIIKLSGDVEKARAELAKARNAFGGKLGEAHVELAKMPGEFAKVRNVFWVKLVEARTELSDELVDLSGDVAKIVGILAGAGIGNAIAASPERNVAKSNPRTFALKREQSPPPYRETPLAISPSHDAELGRRLD